MADRAVWTKRVSEWRASGLSSTEFCRGRDFTAGGLRNAAHHIERELRERRTRKVRVARVLRTSTAMEVARLPAPTLAPVMDNPVVVEIGGARIRVTRGFDHETLAAVLSILQERA